MDVVASRLRQSLPSGGGGGFTLLEAFAAEDRSSLSWPERDGSILAALGTGGASFYASVMVAVAARTCGRTENGHALRLAGLAALGFVLELFIVEEKLFACRENKIRAAVPALQSLILKFHRRPK
jgi:hypothetical protein